jgi:hypothetical protein
MRELPIRYTIFEKLRNDEAVYDKTEQHNI